MLHFILAFVIFIGLSILKNNIQKKSVNKIAEQFKKEMSGERRNLSLGELIGLLEGYRKEKKYKGILALRVAESIVFGVFLIIGILSLFAIGKESLDILFKIYAVLSMLNAIISFRMIHIIKNKIGEYFKEKGHMQSPQMIEVFENYIKKSYVVYFISAVNTVVFLYMMFNVMH